MWCVPLKIKKIVKQKTEDFSNILTKSKGSPLRIESDRRADFYISIFQNFLKSKTIRHYSPFTDKGSSLAERIIRTIRSLKKNPVFEKGNSDWLSELPSISKIYKNTIHSSTKNENDPHASF